MITVYGLHAGDNRIRYVGVTTVSLNQRMQSHRGHARSGVATPVYQWFRELDCKVYVTPLVRFGDESRGEADRVEAELIRSGQEQRSDFLNRTGGGRSGFTHMDVSKKLVDRKLKGRVFSFETRQKMSEAARRNGLARGGLNGNA